ncbi:hypothetical protein ACFE04_025438 [Oxalis oulophora]
MSTRKRSITDQRRPALTDITNQKNRFSSVPCKTKIAHANDQPTVQISTLPAEIGVDTAPYPYPYPTGIGIVSENGSMDLPSNTSLGDLVCLDEDMSICSSLNSPEPEYVDATYASLAESQTANSVDIYMSEHSPNKGKRIVLNDVEQVNNIINIDDNVTDPQYCATIACDIYKYLRESEGKRRASVGYMENIQNDITARMRAVLIDWLVEVSEEYRLLPETLFLTVNYIDRYLSGNKVARKDLQLVGVACMMIASKYEEICGPGVGNFCSITDNSYSIEEVLQMESDVLNFLKFEMTAPTVTCFLSRFVRAAQKVDEVAPIKLESLSYYLAELSLLEYRMLDYAPSLMAASTIFLARFMMSPKRKPWNPTLQHYTLYEPSDLCGCVMELHRLYSTICHSDLPAVRVKYSQHKYKFAAKKHCPSKIPLEYFQDLSEYVLAS